MKKDKEIIDKIKEIVDKLKPFIMADGGVLEFVKFEDGICYVSFGGACADCALIDYTLKDGVEMAIMSEIPEVIEVRQYTEE